MFFRTKYREWKGNTTVLIKRPPGLYGCVFQTSLACWGMDRDKIATECPCQWGQKLVALHVFPNAYE